MNNNKVIALVVGVVVALFALSLVLRFVLASQAGVPGFYYLGLPIGGISVVILLLLRLGVLNFGQRPGDTTQHWQQHRGVQAPPGGYQAPVGYQPPPGYRPPHPGGYQPPVASAPPTASPPPVAPQPSPVYQPPAPSVSQRLQELETLRASGAISETEYTAKRQQIISNL
jgi:Short C-terminal domain